MRDPLLLRSLRSVVVARSTLLAEMIHSTSASCASLKRQVTDHFAIKELFTASQKHCHWIHHTRRTVTNCLLLKTRDKITNSPPYSAIRIGLFYSFSHGFCPTVSGDHEDCEAQLLFGLQNKELKYKGMNTMRNPCNS